MPRFDVSAEFTLSTEIECDLGYHSFDDSGTEEFSDESYFSTQSVEADGGRLQFVIEADSEEEANEKAVEVITDGIEVEDSNGLTWLVQDVTFSVEEIIVPMNLDRAREIIRVWLDGRDQEDELSEALDFLLAEFDRLGSKIQELGTEIGTLSHALRDAEAKVAELAGDLDRLKNGPDGSEESA